MIPHAPRQRMSEWMDHVAVRVHPRAKRISIKMTLRGKITVVSPRRLRPATLQAILDENREWVERTRERILLELTNNDDGTYGQPPRTISLRAVREEWRLRYRPPNNGTTDVRVIYPGCLAVIANKHDVSSFEPALRQWLRSKAQRRLVPWLERIAEEFDLPFNRVSIRNQRSRWGSCSRGKSISLNLKLLFFPPPLVRYIMIHELCHTVHMNHSNRFWNKVAQCDPLYRKHERELRTAWRYVPFWCDPE
ncbi:MAG: SprT family zinc-dependent metalloprotease [Candidatus Hinthialibacter antarcticus]|nr:SprT family zinc-dependent metalloprotease [Candidatus Hinthialibacter antarcticus]